MRIDVFHDTVCPWCRIGKKHLMAALASWEGEAEIYYHTFFLNAGIPPEGYKFEEYMKAKFATTDLEPFFENPRRAGANIGLSFNFDAIQFAPNTIMSHRLIYLAPTDKKTAIIDAIYDAYFVDGKDIGNLDVLVGLAKSVGLDDEAIRTRLTGDEAHQTVLMEAAQAQQMGVTGVPMFVFDNTFAVSGAQPPEVLLQVIEQVTGKTV